MPIKNYTTRIPAVQTVGEIQGILAAHGARKVMMDYAENGKVTAVTFALECCGSLQGFRLEARPDGVKTVMERERLKCDDEQAERIAWRNGRNGASDNGRAVLPQADRSQRENDLRGISLRAAHARCGKRSW